MTRTKCPPTTLPHIATSPPSLKMASPSHRCQRLRNLEAIARSTIHQSLVTTSSQIAMARCKSSTLTDPKQALDLVRALVQRDINDKVCLIMQEYVDAFFQPAVQNIRKNHLGNDPGSSTATGDAAPSFSESLVREVCINALEHAKEIFRKPNKSATISEAAAKRKRSESPDNAASTASTSGATTTAAGSTSASSLAASITLAAKKRCLSDIRHSSDLALVTSDGKPVRREGAKWDAKRIDSNTKFILGAKACRLLGYKRAGRLYNSHPSLFKYALDAEDKEWLAKNQLIPTVSVGKMNVLIASDVTEIAENMELNGKTEDIAKHSFICPTFLIDKMKIFIDLVRTDPSESDAMMLRRLAEGSSGILHQNGNSNGEANVHDILNEMKQENGVSEDDLGFLQSMNLTSLVREFEMEAATGQGSQHLGILSLADDPEASFPDLVPETTATNGNESANTQANNVNSNMSEALNDIGFN